MSADTATNMQDCSRRGTVLIVEDKKPILETSKLALEQNGFTVLTTVDGAQGVEVFKQHADDIDVVVLDLRMPRMNADEAYRQMRRIQSEVQVIISSGCSSEEVFSYFLEHELAGYLQKPYRLITLINKVHEVMSRREVEIGLL